MYVCLHVLPVTVIHILEVTNIPAFDIPVFNISLPESSAPSLLHYATASDLDPSDVLSYSISSTNPVGAPFSIDPVSKYTSGLDYPCDAMYIVFANNSTFII